MHPQTSPLIGENLTMPAKLRSLVQAQKPEIKIHFQSMKKTYTTLDRIEGTATIMAHVDTHFDAIDIEFVGTSRTYVERLTTAAAASGRSEAFHQFLKLSQPNVQQHYPGDQVLKAGHIYEFPFVFAVPQQLLMRICQHTVRSDAVRDCHYRLPPTFGDKDLTARQKGMDDMAPDMASIRYGIFVKISEVKARGDEAWRSTIASKARRVRVIPAIEEQPPLDVHQEDGEYTMRREKTVRKNMLKGKTGTLVMEAAQPQALQIMSYNDPEARTSTMATVMLRFDPMDEKAKPPKLGSLASKIKVTTYFASCARSNFPTKSASLMDLSQGIHSEQHSLSSRCVANVEWTKQDPTKPDTIERRDSATSMSSLTTGVIPEPSEGYQGKAFYTTRVLVPITLPTNKAFVPTFHSCLISRVYAVKLDLSMHSLGIGTSMELKVPIQVCSERLVGDEFERRESLDVGNDAEIDVDDVSGFFTNFFEPRTIRVPSDHFVGRSRIGSQAPITPPSGQIAGEQQQDDLPPGYEPFGAAANTARMTHHRTMSVPVY